MIVVTNKLKMKPGMAEKMAPMFTRSDAVKEMKGFIKTEVLQTKDTSDYDELKVNMYWETEDDFKAWKESDAFKQAHKGTSSSDSPVLDSELIIQEVASTTVVG